MKFSILGIEVEIHKREERPKWSKIPREDRDLVKILKIVSNYYGFSKYDLYKKDRRVDVVRARAVYFFIARELGNEYRRIGQIVNRDHSTVIHHCERIRTLLKPEKFYFDEKLAREIAELRELL